MFKELYGAILDALFPSKCVFCRTLLQKSEKDICLTCKVKYFDSGQTFTGNGAFSVCTASLDYRGDVRKAFHRFKFGGKIGYAAPFGKIMADTIKKDLSESYDIITWVPISARRKRNRGYDQAMLLAYAVALELEDVAVEILKKIKHTPAQSNIENPTERRTNILDAYDVVDASLIVGKRVLLIDDIFTTGATLSECSRVLLGAGAVEVVGAVFARSGK